MATIAFSIKVVNTEGNPQSGIEVSVFDQSFMPVGTQTEYTDSDGWAQFEFQMITTSFFGEVYVNGDRAGSRKFRDGDSASYTVQYSGGWFGL